MTIKRYIANTTHEAMNQVKMDLGSDAVILSTRKIRRKGFMGWFSKPLIEVTAAVDAYEREINRTSKNPYGSIAEIGNKMDSMERMMSRLVKELESGDQAKREGGYKFFGENQAYFDLLVQNEVRHPYAIQIMEDALSIQHENQKEFPPCFEDALLNALGRDVRPIKLPRAKRRTILFVGPTGVGKTTTLAKLAAEFAIEKGKKVGFITADTYRIAAVDQLRVYAEILDIPMSIVYSPDEIPKALEEHLDRDIVFIDTAGRSIKDQDHEEEITSIIKLGSIDEVYLVISGSTGPESSSSIIKSYNFLEDYRLLFSKMDEVTTYGTILNCRIMSQKPLSYITTGQNVPADIEVADVNRIKDLIIGKEAL